ncbi:hypothetical protein F4809DRAFT_623261 [Biscogniauxia mediterranea]|nr:hypothetical protein F4809DRAFT_623261 [Biscogniauxia mediterranea]
MTMLCKHVECPQRAQSSFSQDCPERPYECMISTLKKIPWYMAQHITVKERHAVYATCCKMITILSTTVDRFPRHERLTPQLLSRLVNAAMLCSGFTVQQKDNVSVLARMEEQKTREFNQPRFADLWCHLYTLGPKPGIPLDVLEFYIAVIREETNRTVDSLNIGQKIALQNRSAGTNGYFGYLWAEVDFPSGPAFDRMTLAEVNYRELQAIDSILRRAVEGGVPPPSYTKGMHGL